MLGHIQRHSRIIKCLNVSLKKFPISFSHFKLYCVQAVKQNNYGVGNTRRQPVKSPVDGGIVIYQVDKSKFFRRLSIYCTLNYSVWLLLSCSMYQICMEMSENNYIFKDSWFASENMRSMVKGLAILSILLGSFLVALVWFYIMRNIKSITLLERSKEVLFETYTPILTVRSFTVPLKDVSGVKSRHNINVYIPLKIKNRKLYFFVDKDGKFLKPSLFDNCIALRRDLRK